MWIHITTANVSLSNKENLTEVLSTEEIFENFKGQKGFRAYYLVENLIDHGQMASITVWDTREDGENFYASPAYQEILSGAVSLLDGKPVMEAFNVRTELEALVPAMN